MNRTSSALSDFFGFGFPLFPSILAEDFSSIFFPLKQKTFGSDLSKVAREKSATFLREWRFPLSFFLY